LKQFPGAKKKKKEKGNTKPSNEDGFHPPLGGQSVPAKGGKIGAGGKKRKISATRRKKHNFPGSEKVNQIQWGKSVV